MYRSVTQRSFFSHSISMTWCSDVSRPLLDNARGISIQIPLPVLLLQASTLKNSIYWHQGKSQAGVVSGRQEARTALVRGTCDIWQHLHNFIGLQSIFAVVTCQRVMLVLFLWKVQGKSNNVYYSRKCGTFWPWGKKRINPWHSPQN